MNNPWIVVAAILAVGLLYVLLPVIADTWRRFRPAKRLRCPGTGMEANVAINTLQAAFTSAFGRPHLTVKACSLWPGQKDCVQDCLASAALM